jgi:hypothetical protein
MLAGAALIVASGSLFATPVLLLQGKVVFFLADRVIRMSQTFEDKALCRIRGTGGGWAFSPETS